jgi:hypothetical protein
MAGALQRGSSWAAAKSLQRPSQPLPGRRAKRPRVENDRRTCVAPGCANAGVSAQPVQAAERRGGVALEMFTKEALHIASRNGIKGGGRACT